MVVSSSCGRYSHAVPYKNIVKQTSPSPSPDHITVIKKVTRSGGKTRREQNACLGKPARHHRQAFPSTSTRADQQSGAFTSVGQDELVLDIQHLDTAMIC